MIRRWTVRLCLVVILLTLPLGAFSLSETPAVAETVVPSYGAPAYVDGSPVGGGAGYLNIIDPSEADYVVSTAAALKSALAKATSGQIVYVADGATITIDSDDDMYNDYHVADVKAGVTLAGGRGRSGITGGMIKISSSYRVYPDSCWFVYLAAGARLTGLTIEGPYSGTSTTVSRWAGVRCIGNGVEIDNNLIYNFPRIGVFAAIEDVTDTWVHHNNIHHCQMDGMGYGVEISATDIYHVASAIIEGNKFDYVRHAVCGGRGRSSWVFRYNSLGANCWGNNVDSHGNNDLIPPAMDGDEYVYCAGENIEVYNNTSLTPIDNFVYIRGTPYSTGSISVHNNWSYNTLFDRVCQHLSDLPAYGYDATLDSQPTHPFVRMHVYNNWFGTTPPPDYSPPAANQPPATPAAPLGTANGQVDTSYTYSVKTTDPDGDNIAYHIHWGDGTGSTTGQLNSGVTGSASHAWTQTGTYDVTVRATDSEGNDSAWSPLLRVTIATAVSNQPPATPAAPLGTANGQVDTSYTYSVKTTDPDGDNLAYHIHWGDGTSSNTAQLNSGVTGSASHAWTQTGTYDVTVKGTDSEGNASEWSPSLRVTIATAVSNQPPAAPAAPSGPVGGQVGVSCQYGVKTTDPDGDAIAYSIDWGDGTSSTIGELDSGVTGFASHVWAQAGTYAVIVQATDSQGNVSAWSPTLTVRIAGAFQTSTVSNNSPTIPATIYGVASGKTSVTYLYSTVATDPDGDALSYTFYWGDGTLTTVPQVDSGATAYAAHSWALPGAYSVRVSATDSKGTASGWSDAISVTILTSVTGDPAGTGDADTNGDATTPATEQEGGSSVGPSDPGPDNAVSDSAPMSPDYEGVPSGGPQGSGFVLWLLSVGVIVGAGVWLTSAMVRDTLPKPPRGYGDFRDRQDP